MERRYLEAAGVRSTLEPAIELENHARVELDGDDRLGDLQELLGEVPSAGSDLEDDVGRLDPGLVDDGLHQHGVLQDVLPLRLLEGNAAAPPMLVALLLDLAARHARASPLCLSYLSPIA